MEHLDETGLVRVLHDGMLQQHYATFDAYVELTSDDGRFSAVQEVHDLKLTQIEYTETERSYRLRSLEKSPKYQPIFDVYFTLSAIKNAHVRHLDFQGTTAEIPLSDSYSLRIYNMRKGIY